MALTINTPYKTNTVASVSGTTFTSNGTPFVVGDVGRFLVFTNGAAIGQIRRIATYVSTSVVTVDLAWNTSQLPEFTDSLPSIGNTWQMSLTMDDIDDGTHIIKDSAESYRQVPAAGLVTLSGVFIADTSKNLVLNCELFKITTSSYACFGYLHPGGYAIYGCSIVDLGTGSAGGWSGDANGTSGDLHLYGCNIASSLTAAPFWRLYRGNTHIVRFVDCDLSGNFAGRVQGTRSALVRCTYRGNTSSSQIAGIGAISDFGLIQACRVQASYQALYVSYAVGAGTVISPIFANIGDRIFRAGAADADRTYVIEDYVQAQITAAPNVISSQGTRAGSLLSFRQWIDTRIVNAALAPITDAARRVTRNGAAAVIDNVTTSSGAFTRYTAEVRRFSMVTGYSAWSAGTAYGPFEEAIASYKWQPATLSLPLETSSSVQFTMLTDVYVTQINKATVDAYATIDTFEQLYDRSKSWFVDNLATPFPTFGVQRINGDGNSLDCGDANVVVDSAAGTAFDVVTGTNTITVKTTALVSGAKFSYIKTTGTISAAMTTGGAYTYTGTLFSSTLTPSFTGGALTIGAVGTYGFNSNGTTVICTPTAPGTYELGGGTHLGTIDLRNASGVHAITVVLASGVTYTTANNTGAAITVSLPIVYNVGTVSGFVANTHIIVWNETTDTIIYDGKTTSPLVLNYIEGGDFTTGDTVRVYNVFVAADGSSATKKERISSVAGAAGWAVSVEQVTCPVYAAFYATYAVTGATVYASGDFVRDGANLQIDLDDADDLWYAYRMFMFDKYDIWFNTGNRAWFTMLTASDAGNVDLGTGSTLDNLNVNTVKQQDAVNVTADSGTNIGPVQNPTTGGGGITMYSGGKVLTTSTSGISPSETQIKSWVREELATEMARIDATVSSRNATAPDNAGIASIKAKTDNLPVAPAAVSDVPTATANATAVMASTVETGKTFLQITRLSAAALLGKSTGSPTDPIFRDVNDTKDRITGTTDTNGNRLTVVLDAT